MDGSGIINTAQGRVPSGAVNGWECPQCHGWILSGTYHSCPHYYTTKLQVTDNLYHVLERIAIAL